MIIQSENDNEKFRDILSYKTGLRPKVLVFGLIAGLISSIAISTLIVMVEKVTAIPAGAFYLVLISAITQSHSYSNYMIIAGLLLHFAAGGLVGVIMAIPFARRIYAQTGTLRGIEKYSPAYGLCFGFALWLILFIPITYFMVLPALNNIKQAPLITQYDPTGRIASLVIDDVLYMQNRIIIGALAFNVFYGLLTAIIINSLYAKGLYNKSSFEEGIIE